MDPRGDASGPVHGKHEESCSRQIAQCALPVFPGIKGEHKEQGSHGKGSIIRSRHDDCSKCDEKGKSVKGLSAFALKVCHGLVYEHHCRRRHVEGQHGGQGIDVSYAG